MLTKIKMTTAVELAMVPVTQILAIPETVIQTQRAANENPISV